MSSDFETYEQEFGTLTAEITNKVGRIPKLGGGLSVVYSQWHQQRSSSFVAVIAEHNVTLCTDKVGVGDIDCFCVEEKTQLVLNVDKQLEEVRELLEQMDLEVREIPVQSRGMYSGRLKSYKQEMEKLEKDFKRSRIAYSDEVRNELLGDDGSSSESQRAHLLDNTERLERSSRRLEAGYQIAVETARRLIVERKMTPILSTGPESESVAFPPNHAGPGLAVSSAATNGRRRFFHLDFKNGAQQIGQEILSNLHSDREKIQRSRDRLRETDANLGKSSRILTGMLRRVCVSGVSVVCGVSGKIIQNRILVFILGAIILLTIVLAIYFNLRGH
ncbi:hypothetical protein NFI96_016119 [Prochilodus magdalenae]|nr:hypothetical protein NFI96_016119 [Prochilodus magdalenae]